MKITVENFQSISKAQVDVKGLTVITGQNNTGKSALARAVSSVFTNPRGNSFVRIGSPSTSVNIDFEDGNQIKWTKGKNVNEYEVNGKLIQKVGTDVPDEVYLASLVKPVEVDNKEVYPQVAKQFQQVFLIDLPPSSLASALSNVDVIQQLEKASALVRSDIKEITGQLKTKNNDLVDAKDYLKKFNGVDSVEGILAHIETLDAQIKHKENIISTLEKENALRQQFKAIIDELNELDRVSIDTVVNDVVSLENSYNVVNADHLKREQLKEVIGNLTDVIKVSIDTRPDGIENRNKILKEVVDLQVKQERLNKAYEILKGTVDIEKIDTDHILIENKTTVLNDIVELQDRQVKAYKLYQALKGVRNVEFNIDTDRIEALEEVIRLKRNRSRLKLAIYMLEGGLETLPEIRELKMESGVLDELVSIKESKDKFIYAVDIINKELVKVDTELSELHIGDICPLCNQGIGH
jgi:hypothetical protein